MRHMPLIRKKCGGRRQIESRACGVIVGCVALVAQAAQGDDRIANCSLWVEENRLCLARISESKECRPLDQNKVDLSDRCLVQSFDSIAHCYGVTIAQNMFVLLTPLAIHYQLFDFRNPSKTLYSEDRIQASCLGRRNIR